MTDPDAVLSIYSVTPAAILPDGTWDGDPVPSTLCKLPPTPTSPPIDPSLDPVAAAAAAAAAATAAAKVAAAIAALYATCIACAGDADCARFSSPSAPAACGGGRCVLVRYTLGPLLARTGPGGSAAASVGLAVSPPANAEPALLVVAAAGLPAMAAVGTSYHPTPSGGGGGGGAGGGGLCGAGWIGPDSLGIRTGFLPYRDPRRLLLPPSGYSASPDKAAWRFMAAPSGGPGGVLLDPAGRPAPACGAVVGGACTPCPSGTWSPVPAGKVCTVCPAGTYGAGPGATSAETCLLCPAGQSSLYKAAPAVTACFKAMVEAERAWQEGPRVNFQVRGPAGG